MQDLSNIASIAPAADKQLPTYQAQKGEITEKRSLQNETKESKTQVKKAAEVNSSIKQAGRHSFVIETTYPDGSKHEYPSSKALQYAEQAIPLKDIKTALTA